MANLVIAMYRPRDGKADALLEEVSKHLPVLRELGLVTERKAVVLRAADGTLLEIFEWESEGAVKKAHDHPVVKQMWNRFEKVCTYVSLSDLEESKVPFPHFEPVDL